MRTLAVGDIHGSSIAFDAIFRVIDPKPDDLLVTLGDYIDGGPDSRGVMERLIALESQTRLVLVRGNHEEMLLRAWDFPQEVDLWLKVGGRETLASYPDSRFAELHSEFLRDRCVDFFETETHIFVHGGVDPDLPMSMQPVPTLRWKTFRDPKPHVSGKIVVCGHTPQQDGLPHNLGHSICLDTGAGARSGWLTCLDINSNQIIQANQNGEIRFAELPPAHGKRLPLRSNDALP